MSLPNYYRILGVSRAASPREIKTAYRRLALRYHPDLHPNNPNAEEVLKAINQAYSILGDAQQRRQYDLLTVPVAPTTYVPAHPASPTPHYSTARHARPSVNPARIILLWVVGIVTVLVFANTLRELYWVPPASGARPVEIQLGLQTPQTVQLFADSKGILHAQEAGVDKEWLRIGDKIALPYRVQTNQGRVFIGIKGQAMARGHPTLTKATPIIEGEWIERSQSGTIEILVPQEGQYVIFLNADNFAGVVEAEALLE